MFTFFKNALNFARSTLHSLTTSDDAPVSPVADGSVVAASSEVEKAAAAAPTEPISQSLVRFDADFARIVAQQYQAHLQEVNHHASEIITRNLQELRKTVGTLNSLIQRKNYVPTRLLTYFLWSWFLLGKPLPEFETTATAAFSLLLRRLPAEVHADLILLMSHGIEYIAEEVAQGGDDTLLNAAPKKTKVGQVSFCFDKSNTIFLGIEYHEPHISLTGPLKDTLPNSELLKFFFYLYVLPQPIEIISSVAQLINVRLLLPHFTLLQIFPEELYKVTPPLMDLGIRALNDFAEKNISFDLISEDFFHAVNELFVYIQPFINLREAGRGTSLLTALKYIIFLQQAYPYLNEDNQEIADSQDDMRGALLQFLRGNPSLLSLPLIQELHRLISNLPQKKSAPPSKASTSSTQASSYSKQLAAAEKIANPKKPQPKDLPEINAFIHQLEQEEAEHQQNKQKKKEQGLREKRVYRQAEARRKRRARNPKKTSIDEKLIRLKNYKQQLGLLYNDKTYRFIFTEYKEHLRELDHKNIRLTLLKITNDLMQKNDGASHALKLKFKALLFTLIDEEKCQSFTDQQLYFNILSNVLYIDRRYLLANNDPGNLLPLPQPEQASHKSKKNKRSHRPQPSYAAAAAASSSTSPAPSDFNSEETTIIGSTENQDDESQKKARALLDVYSEPKASNVSETPSPPVISPAESDSKASDVKETPSLPVTSAVDHYRVVAYHVPFFDPATFSYTTQIYHCADLSVQFITIHDGIVSFAGKRILATQDLKGIATLLGYFDINGVYIATGVETVKLREKDSARFKITTHQLNPYPIYYMPSSLQHYTLINGMPCYYAPPSMQEAAFLQTQSTASQYCSIAYQIIYQLAQKHRLLLSINYLDLLYYVANFQINSKIHFAQQLDPVYLGVVLCCMDEDLAFSAVCDFIEQALNYRQALFREFLNDFERITDRLQENGPVAVDPHPTSSVPISVQITGDQTTFTLPPEEPLSAETQSAWDLSLCCAQLQLVPEQKDWITHFFDQLYLARPDSHRLISKENYLKHYCRLNTAFSELFTQFENKFPDEPLSLARLLSSITKAFPQLIDHPVIPEDSDHGPEVNQMLIPHDFNKSTHLLTLEEDITNSSFYIAEVLQIFSPQNMQECVGTLVTIENIIASQAPNKIAFVFPLLINNHYCALFVKKEEDGRLRFTWCNPKSQHPLPECLVLALETVFSFNRTDLNIIEQSLQNEYDGLYCGTAIFSAIVFASQQIKNNFIERWLDFPLRLLASTTPLTIEARWDIYLTPKQKSLRQLHIDMIRDDNTPVRAAHFFDLFKSLVISEVNEADLLFGTTNVSARLATLFGKPIPPSITPQPK